MFATVAATKDPKVVAESAAFATSLLVLILLAFRRARVIHEGKRIDHIRDFLAESVPFIEKMERRHANLDELKGSLNELQGRVAPLLSPIDGVVASLRHCKSAVAAIKESSSVLQNGCSGDDVDGVLKNARLADQSVSKFESTLAALRGHAASVSTFQERLSVLSGPEGIVAEVRGLKAKLEGIGDLDQILSDLESGDENEDGDLDDQVKELSETIEDAIDRLGALGEISKDLDRVKARLAAAVGANLSRAA
jgi:prefoldin subunit 5